MRHACALVKAGVKNEENRAVTDAPTSNMNSGRLQAILAHFSREGFSRHEPKLLQPAGVFLDRLGEDFRGRLYLTSDARGAELCLRPEYTIPVCLDYLASPEVGAPAAFAYGGAIFRGGGESGEVLQAGLESFGREDREAADAEILAVALEAAKVAGAGGLDVRLGDAGLAAAFLDRLELPPVWRRRLASGHARGQSLAAIFEPAANNGGEGAGVLAALEKVDHNDARKLVEDLLSIAGVSIVGGRGAAEIAERFLDQATLKAGDGVPSEKRALAEAFFAVEGAPDAASAALRRLMDDAKLELGRALDSFDTRSSFIAARGLALDDMTFCASFARRLDYYTGFVFEARRTPTPQGAPVIGGGRYDRLLKTLGAARDIAAVGAAIWVDRLEGDDS